MKILMISQDYPPHPLGGVGRHVEGLSNALRKIVDLTVLTPAKGIPDSLPAIVRVPQIGPSTIYPYTLFQENQAMTVKGIELCIQQQFDLIHCHDYHSFLAGSAIATFAHIPLLMTKHFVKETNTNIRSSDPLIAFRLRNTEYFTKLERWSIEQPVRIICVSMNVFEDIGSIDKMLQEKCVVIQNGTDIEQNSPKESRETIRARFCHSSEKLLLLVGRLNWRKGGDIAIRAIKILQTYSLRLLFVGEGPDLETLKDLAEDLGVLNKVSFAGYIEGQELADIYRSADMVLVPSRSEAFGLVVQEALALKKIVIGSRIGGILEQIEDGKNGLLCDPNPESLATKIEWVLQEERSANAFLYRVTSTSWETIAFQTFQEYKTLLVNE